MKLFKLFLWFAFTILLVIEVFGQPMVDIPLSANNGTYSIPLAIGFDPTATSGIDPQFGESDLPPFPPPGAFEIRFDLTPYTGQQLSSYKDYRNSPPGYVGEIEHLLWWQFDSPQINLSYNLPELTLMTLTDQYGLGILYLGPFYDSGTVTIPTSYTYNFTKCLLIMDYLLPVELISFSASIIDDVIALNWSTATELNNSGFEIQKTSPLPSPYQGEGVPPLRAGRCWEAIGFVPGFGTTTEPKSYSFTDEDVSTGTYKYRLKQIDFDGTFTYSNEIGVEVDFTPKEFVLYQNYPNPFNPNTTIKYEIPSVTLRQAQSDIVVSLKVYDVLGNEVATLVNEEKQSGIYEVEFFVGQDSSPDIASGIYFYQLKAEGFVQTKKMILLR